MAVRYNISFKSFPHDGTAKDYLLEIHDNQFSGTAQATVGNAEGLNLNWRGDMRNPFAEIIPSSLQYTMQFRSTEDDKYTFINDLVNSEEERFFIRVYREGGFWWQGVILIDEGSHQDYPFVNFNISAVDGLARLRNVKYRDKENDVDFAGRETLLQHIYNCLDLINMDFPGLTTNPRFRTNLPIFAEDMPTGGESCLGLTTLDHSVFTIKDINGNIKYTTAWEVLRNIAGLFGASFYFSDGGYWLMTKERYKNAGNSQDLYNYNPSGSFISKTSTDISAEINANERFKIAKMSTLYLPALAEYCVNYNHKTSQNLATGVHFSGSLPGYVVDDRLLINNITLDEDVETRLKIRVKFRTKSNVINAADPVDYYPIHYYRFSLKIQLGNKYLKRIIGENDFFEADNSTYEWAINWTEDNFFIVRSNQHTLYDENNNVFSEINLDTLPIPTNLAGEDLTIQVFLKDIFASNFQLPPQNGEPGTDAFFWETALIDVRLENEVFTAATPNQNLRVFCAQSDLTNNTQQNDISLLIGDGPLHYSESRLEYNDEPTSGWKIQDVGTLYYDIADLNASTRLSMQKRVIEVKSGSIMGAGINFHQKIIFDDKRYYFLTGTFSAFYERWTGRWALAQTDTGVIILPPQDEPNDIETFFIGNNGGNNNLADAPIKTLSTPGDLNLTGGAYEQIKLETNQLARYLSITRSRINYPSIVNKVNGQNEIFIDPLDYVWIFAGTKFWLINAATGEAEQLTATNDYSANSVTLEIDEDIAGSYPAGSYVLNKTLNADGSSINTDLTTCQMQKAENQTGSRFDVEVTNFPSDDLELDAKVDLHRSGVSVLHGVGYSIDRSVSPIQIVFNFPLRNEHFVLKCCNDAAQWVEKYLGYSGTDLTISAGVLADITNYDLELKVLKSGVQLFKDFEDGYTVDTINNQILLAKIARGENIIILKK